MVLPFSRPNGLQIPPKVSWSDGVLTLTAKVSSDSWFEEGVKGEVGGCRVVYIHPPTITLVSELPLIPLSEV